MDKRQWRFHLKLPALLQPRVLMQALQAVFSRPYTTDYPSVPYEPPAGFRGRVRFNADACIGCGACAQVCPSKCIEVLDDEQVIARRIRGSAPFRLVGMAWRKHSARQEEYRTLAELMRKALKGVGSVSVVS